MRFVSFLSQYKTIKITDLQSVISILKSSFCTGKTVIFIFSHSKNTFFSQPVCGIDILTNLHPASYVQNLLHFL